MAVSRQGQECTDESQKKESQMKGPPQQLLLHVLDPRAWLALRKQGPMPGAGALEETGQNHPASTPWRPGETKVSGEEFLRVSTQAWSRAASRTAEGRWRLRAARGSKDSLCKGASGRVCTAVAS